LRTRAPSEARLRVKNIAAKKSENDRRMTGRILRQAQIGVTCPINAIRTCPVSRLTRE
jgi:hypothetical protein